MNKSIIGPMLSGLNDLKWSITVKGIVTGVVVGFLVVCYRLGIEFGYGCSLKIYEYLKVHPFVILPWVLVIMAAGFLISWLVKLEPMAMGSGIPQAEGLLLYGMKMRWLWILCVRFIAGILSSLFGTSLGREGPLIQIGACGGQAIAQKCGRNKLEENYLITGGAAAGLSAAFNAPVSGIMFALEEIHRSFSPVILIAATTASLTADVVSKYFFGLKPVLNFLAIPQLPQRYYLWLLPLGIAAGVIGVLMNKALLSIQILYNKIPAFLRPFLALLIALPCGLMIPEVLGGGQNLVEAAERAQTGLILLLVFLAVKMLFTCISFGSGIPGGIFMPILSVGALSGSIFGLLITNAGVPVQYIPTFCVCAMAGALSASVKAPVTSILLIAEMSGTLVHFLPVAVCSFTALLFSDLLHVEPIYEALLERLMHQDKSTATSTKKEVLLEMPVEMGSTIANKKIGQVEWPANTLVVGIRRGGKEIVPDGNTKIMSGDYLIVLSAESQYGEMNRKLRKLCCSVNI